MEILSPNAPRTAKFALRKIAYHEVGHAVLYWNLGFGVRRVRLDAARGGGSAQPQKNPRDRTSRIARAVTCVGGLAAHSYLEPDLDWDDVGRSISDLRRALLLLSLPEELTDGEQLEVALRLTGRVVTLLAAPELRRQVECLVPPLLEMGYLFEFQVEKRLRRLIESPAARRRCREFVSQLERERAELVQSVKGHYPEFDWATGPGFS